MYQYKCSLDRVVDGDTVDITIDLGFTITTRQRVRLEGLNAPERNTPDGMDAANYVRQWFVNHTALTVESKKPGAGDKYGRYLARISGVATRGESRVNCLNDDLIAAGHAVAWDGQGSKPV